MKSIFRNTESKIYIKITIRSIQGQVYYCSITNRVVGKREFTGQIMKA
jgi:hypothetical protein